MKHIVRNIMKQLIQQNFDYERIRSHKGCQIATKYCRSFFV